MRGAAEARVAPGGSLLEIRGLVTTFPVRAGRVEVVARVDLDLGAGEILALVGESGCGKSMTALSVMRLVPKPGRIEAGEIRLGGRNLLGLTVPEMRRARGAEVAMIFQEPMTSLNPVVPAGAQVVEAIRLHERVGVGAARERTVELFRRVGIPDPRGRLEAYPHQLSGGLRQRVMISMALVTRPRMLIADEPTTALDVTIQAQILELLRELERELGSGVLLITHDLGVVNELADRVAVMYGGRIVEEGSRERVLGGARHPYTQGLLRSIPARGRRGERLSEIRGTVPSRGDWPPGCPFCNRCPRAFEPCDKSFPEPTTVGPDHRAWCFAVEKDEAIRRGGGEPGGKGTMAGGRSGEERASS